MRRPGATDASVNISEADAAMIARMRKPVWLIVFVGAFVGLVVWPLLTLPAKVFSLGYFRFYVVLTFIILIIAAAIGIFLPIWEARGTVTKLFQWQARAALHDPSPYCAFAAPCPVCVGHHYCHHSRHRHERAGARRCSRSLWSAASGAARAAARPATRTSRRRARRRRWPPTRPTARPPSPSLCPRRTLSRASVAHSRAARRAGGQGAVLASISAKGKAAELSLRPGRTLPRVVISTKGSVWRNEGSAWGAGGWRRL